MLVLSRRLNQTIVIAGRVRVTVLAITPNRVELGVEAPLQIAVDREEIHLRRQNAQPALAAEPESRTEILSPRRQDAKVRIPKFQSSSWRSWRLGESYFRFAASVSRSITSPCRITFSICAHARIVSSGFPVSSSRFAILPGSTVP